MRRKVLLAVLVVMTAAVGAAVATKRKPHSLAVERAIWDQKMGENYGVADLDQLRARLQKPVAEMNGHDADLCGALRDTPDQIEIWVKLQKMYPDDFLPHWALYEDYLKVADYEHALPHLEAVLAEPDLKRLLASRNWSFCKPHRDHCTMLRRLGRREESISACRDCIEQGCNECRVTLGRTLVEDGRTFDALELLDKAIATDRQSAHAYFVRGLAHLKRQELDQANDDWASALKRDPGYTPAQRMIERPGQSFEDELAWERKHAEGNLGLDLAWCGHYMRELDLPERARRCDELAEKLDPGSTDAQVLWHLAENDLPAAYAMAQTMLKKDPPTATVEAISDIYMQSGKQEEARRLFQYLIEGDLRSEWAHAELREACEELGDLKCVQHEKDIQGGRAGH